MFLSFNDDKEYIHWHNDKHITKLYSLENNMDPRPNHPVLMVTFNGMFPLFSYLKSMVTSFFVDTMCRHCH